MQTQELAWPSIQSQLSSQFPSLAFTAMPVRPLIVRLIFMEFWVWADVTLRAWWNDLCNSCMESTWKGWISWCHLPWATNAPTSQVAPSKKQSKYMQEEMLPVMCTCSEAPNHSVSCTSSPSRHLLAALNRQVQGAIVVITSGQWEDKGMRAKAAQGQVLLWASRESLGKLYIL